MYIRLSDSLYPVDPRADHPNVSFPFGWLGGVVSGTEYAVVTPVDAPSVDGDVQVCAEGAPELSGGAWRQSWVVSARPADEARERLHAKRRAARTRAELAGFVFDGHLIDSDRDSVMRISNAATTALAATITGASFETVWDCADGYEMPLNASGVTALQAALSAHGQACHDRSMALKALIDSETDLLAASAAITEGWPSAS